MPLQYTETDDLTPTYQSAPPVQMPAPPETAETEAAVETPRYDGETVQKIIALAQEMQTHHRATLTASDIEDLGREVGVEPDFVRRALAAIEKQKRQPVLINTNTRRREISRRTLSVSRLTRKQRATALAPAALYTVLMPLLMGTHYLSTDAGIFLYFLLPVALAFGAGFIAKSKRAGMLSGSLLGISAFIGIMINNMFHHGEFAPTFAEILPPMAMFLFAGIALGTSGASIRQFMSEAHKKRRLRLVLEDASEADGKAANAAQTEKGT